MNERGMTLVEVLAAVALLALLASALAAWTTTTARATRTVVGPLAWEAAARATLRQIEDDLLVGDNFGDDLGDGLGNTGGEERVWVTDGTLRIRTRERGPAVVAYALEPETRTLLRNADRLLLPVASWDVVRADGRLQVTIQDDGGRRVSGEWSVP